MISMDMKRLGANRIGCSPRGWAALCLCAWPLASVIYLLKRRAVQEQLIQAAWHLIGGASLPPHTSHQRLVVLQQAGLIGQPVFRACRDILARQEPYADAALAANGKRTAVTVSTKEGGAWE
jgi:hypothetical protein